MIPNTVQLCMFHSLNPLLREAGLHSFTNHRRIQTRSYHEMNTLSFTLVLALTSQVHSLSIIPGSPCFDTCNGNNATSQGDIVCTDSDFTTDTGVTLSTCLNCLHGSSYRNGFISDSNLFLCKFTRAGSIVADKDRLPLEYTTILSRKQ